MTAVIEPIDTFVEIAAELKVIGSAVVSVGLGAGGEDVLALWNVSPIGNPTGAWIFPRREAFSSKVVAQQILALLERRAITSIDFDDVNSVMRQLTAAAGINIDRWWERQVFSPVQSFIEIVSRRDVYLATVTALRVKKKSIIPLEWSRDFSAFETPRNFDTLRHISPVGIALGNPVVSEILTVSRVLNWLVTIWIETEQVKGRRRPVWKMHGDTEILPPSWLEAVKSASSNRLPL